MPDIELKYLDHDKTHIDDIERVTEHVMENKYNDLNVDGKHIGITQKKSHWLYPKKLETVTTDTNESYVDQYYTDDMEKRSTMITTTNLIDVNQSRINTSVDTGQIEYIQKIITQQQQVTSTLNVSELETEVEGKQADIDHKVTTLTVTNPIIEAENKPNNNRIYRNQADFNKKIILPPVVTTEANMKKVQKNNFDIYSEQTDNVSKVTTSTAISQRNVPEKEAYIYRKQTDFLKNGKESILKPKLNTKKLDLDGKQVHNIQKLTTSTILNVTKNGQSNFNIDSRQSDDIEKILITKTNVTEIKENNIDVEENETQTKNLNSSSDAQKLNTQYTSPEIQSFQEAISNLSNVTETFANHLKFTDFLRNIIDVLITFEDRELGNFANTFNEEIKKCNHDNCAFDELFRNFESRNYITHKMRTFENIPTTELRDKLTEFQKQIKSENLESSTKYIIDYINNITYRNSQDKFMTVLHNFKALSSEAHRNESDFENLIKEEMKTIFFDHYSSLDRNIQLGLGKLLSLYVRPIEQNMGRSFKRWHPENNINETEEDYFDKFDLVGIRRLLEDHKIVKRQIIAQNRSALLNTRTSTDVKTEDGNAMVDDTNDNTYNIINNAEYIHKPATELIPHLTIASPISNIDMTTNRHKKRRKRRKRRRKSKRMRFKKRRTTNADNNGFKALVTGNNTQNVEFG